MEPTRLEITKLPNRDTVIIKQIGQPEFFVSSYNVVAIDTPVLVFIVKFLLQNEMMSKDEFKGMFYE
jgi:hypothetical protein